MKLELIFINLIILYLIKVRQFQGPFPEKWHRILTKSWLKITENSLKMPQNMRVDFLNFTPQNRDVEPKSVPVLQLKLSLRSINLLDHFLAKNWGQNTQYPSKFLIELGPHKRISKHRLNGPGLKNQKIKSNETYLLHFLYKIIVKIYFPSLSFLIFQLNFFNGEIAVNAFVKIVKKEFLPGLRCQKRFFSATSIEKL
jgi:hypothetical protein